jgi:hypothetical protein
MWKYLLENVEGLDARWRQVLTDGALLAGLLATCSWLVHG